MVKNWDCENLEDGDCFCKYYRDFKISKDDRDSCNFDESGYCVPNAEYPKPHSHCGMYKQKE